MPSCANCEREDVSAYCSLCKTVYYCDRKCQNNHWYKHKRYCSGYSPPRSINDFELLDIIGTGNFSEIYHVVETRTGREFAMKKVNKQRVQQLNKTADVLMEKHCLNRLKGHEQVVTLHETFKDDMELYFLMDLVPGGELWHKCKSFGVGEPLAKFYFKQVLEALEYMHGLGIVHRDLKTENVMLTKTHRIKFIDFGTAMDLQHPEVEIPGNHMRKKKFPYFVGTPHFMPPEGIQNKFSNEKSDVWSAGCMFYYLLAGHPCFQGASDYLIFTKTLNLEYTFPEFFSQDAQELIKSCLIIDADQRPTISDLLQTDYIKSSPTTYPIPSLFDLACKSTALHLKTTEAPAEQIDETFNQLYTKLGYEHPRLSHIQKRLHSYLTKEEVSQSQGI